MEHLTIYENIKRHAKDKHISVNSIEKNNGLAIGSVAKWNTVSPTVGNLKKVADYLGVTVDELLRKEDTQNGRED